MNLTRYNNDYVKKWLIFGIANGGTQDILLQSLFGTK